jgi:hypothetical protein
MSLGFACGSVLKQWKNGWFAALIVRDHSNCLGQPLVCGVAPSENGESIAVWRVV